MNFKGGVGCIGLLVGKEYAGLLGKSAPSISERERELILGSAKTRTLGGQAWLLFLSFLFPL